jgi:hypothetical protein
MQKFSAQSEYCRFDAQRTFRRHLLSSGKALELPIRPMGDYVCP